MLRLVLPLLCACSTKDGDADAEDTGEAEIVLPGVGALGHETHDLDLVTLTVIGDDDDGHDIPRDLEFNPGVEDELWVVNRADDSTVTYRGAGTADQTSDHIVDPYALHFMEEVSSIAFGAPMHADSDYYNFGTCHESRNTYNGWDDGNDFMGPSLWSSDPDIYGISNQEAIEYVAQLYGISEAMADLGSHLDMLHQAPLCMGIAWETENAYWVFNGLAGSIDRNDFNEDHGVGYDDHDDGLIRIYVEGEVSRVEDVPSHLVYDPASAFLYIADTGNNAIKVLDTTSGTEGLRRYGYENYESYYQWDDALMWTLIDGESFGIEQPSGLDLVEDTLLITDHATGIIHAFDLEGNQIDYLDTGLGEGALMGITARSLDDVWFVDAASDRVLRLQPAE